MPKRKYTAPKQGTRRTKWFTDARFGMFIHWGTYAMAARHEHVQRLEHMSNEEYQKYFDNFCPDLYDPREWARMAREAGMKYMVVTSKHHEGFCLWDSKQTGFKATKTPWGKDLLKPMLKAFRDEGLKVGFYYSLIDWHHPEYSVDRMHPLAHDKAFRKREKGRDTRKYMRYLHKQVEELLTQFGKIDIAWFDFSYPGPDGKGKDDWQSEKLVKMIRKLQPDILIDDRLDLPEAGDFMSPEQYMPNQTLRYEDGSLPVWEGCQTFSGSWGYSRDEETWKGTQELIEMLIEHVSKGGNLLLNVGPTSRGEFDDRAQERLRGIGEWMRRHSRSIYGCTVAPDEFPPPPRCMYTFNPRTQRLYVHVLSWPPLGSIQLPGLSGKVKYAQLLNDGSDVHFLDDGRIYELGATTAMKKHPLVIDLPAKRPNVNVPVVELMLK